jgi:AcrR family transcriptional regulator
MSAVVRFPGRGSRPPSYDRLVTAMLIASGEMGYEEVSVKDVLERAPASRATFYKHFDDKEDCFAQAYRELCDWLYERIVSAASRQRTWREALRAGLTELLEFCATESAIAQALFVEVHAAGPRARAQREELMERLAQSLDGARAETSPERAPPSVTATFTVGAVDNLVTAKLMAGDAPKAPELLPGLLYFVVGQYFGEEAAWEEMTAAPLASWQARRDAAVTTPWKC